MKTDAVYFLDWLEQNGISKQSFLNNIRPENQHWRNDITTFTLETYTKVSSSRWLMDAFLWRSNILKRIDSDEKVFTVDIERLDNDWLSFLDSLPSTTNILFSKERILDYKIVKLQINIKFEGE